MRKARRLQREHEVAPRIDRRPYVRGHEAGGIVLLDDARTFTAARECCAREPGLFGLRDMLAAHLPELRS